MHRKKLVVIHRALVILLIVAIYELVSSFFGIFNEAKLKALNLFSKLKYELKSVPPAVKDIVIVTIDNKAYEEFGKKWPWGREIFANLVCKLYKYNPKVIGIDLAFVGESPGRKEADEILAQAFKDAGNVVIASFLGREGEYICPSKLFADSVLGYGFTNKPLDKDSTVRRIKLVSLSSINTVIDYTFELKIVSAFLGAPLHKIDFNGKEIIFSYLIDNTEKFFKIPVDKNGIMPFNFSAATNDFKIISVLDVFKDKVDSGLFKNKIVLMGMFGEGFQDVNLTPLGILPGVIIVANGIVMLLENDFIKITNPIINFFVLLIFTITSGLTFFSFRVFKGFIWMLLFITLFVLMGIIFISNNIILDFFSAPFIIILMYPSINFYKYARLIMETLKLKRMAITDILTGLYSHKYFQLKLYLDLKAAVKEEESLAIVLFEIGGLEQITASLGTEKADEVIVEVARLIRRHSRRTRRVDLISRYSEKGFGALLHNTTHEGGMGYANRICKIVGENSYLGDKKAKVFLSAGVSAYPYIDTRSSKVLIGSCEIALFKAKKEPMGGICLYDKSSDKVSLGEFKGEEEYIVESDLGYVASDLNEKNMELVESIRRLRSLQEDIIKMERVSAMGKVTAQIHHELNNPLHNLGSFLETVKKRGRWDSEVEEFVGLAIEEVRRMKKLSQEMRDFYKPVMKEKVDVDINNILDEMLKMSDSRLEASNIKVVKEFDFNLPKVKGNKEELKQVFLNMIINAVEAMDKGGVLTVVSRVSDKELKSSRMVEVLIRDTGYGIAPENTDKIFQPFFTTKGDSRGTGLGLYASIEIVKRHGGSIDVKSRVNAGTEFKLYFPFLHRREEK